MSEKLKFEATLDNSDFLKSSKEMASGLGGVASAAKAAFVAFAAFEGVKFFQDAYKEAKEAEIATQKLTAALGKQSKALADQANALQFKSRATDDEITAMQAALATYVKSEDAVLKLTPAILDMAEATGQDLKSAALQVGRAIADDSEEMGRYKIKVDGAAGSNERAQSILEGLSKKFAGQAESASKASGQVETLRKTWQGFLQSVGETINPLVDDVSKKLSEMVENATNALEKARNPQTASGQKALTSLRDFYVERQKIEDNYQTAIANARTERGKAEISKEYAIEKKRIEARIQAARDAAGQKSDTITGMEGSGLSSNIEAMRKRYQDNQKIALEGEALYNRVVERGLISATEKEKEQLEIRKKNLSDFWAGVYAEASKAESDNEKFRARQKQLDASEAESARNLTDAKIQTGKMAIDSTFAVLEASAKSAEEMKTIRIGEALVDGAAASIAMWRSVMSSSIPYPANVILGGVQQAALIAMTAANVATISQQKFAQGGIVQGASGGDTVPIRAQGGEMMLTREDQKMLLGSIRSGGMGGGGITIAPTVRVDSSMSATEKKRTIRATAEATRDALIELVRTNRLPAGLVAA